VVAARLQGCLWWLQGCSLWLHGCKAAWLHGCKAAWLHGCMAVDWNCKAARLSELVWLQIAALVVQLSCNS